MHGESTRRRNFLERFNACFAKCLLALWPDENKAGGMAFAAETVAIDSPQKQFRWLLGGISVLLLDNFKSFLTLPLVQTEWTIPFVVRRHRCSGLVGGTSFVRQLRRCAESR
jgi:hypothetical protein